MADRDVQPRHVLTSETEQLKSLPREWASLFSKHANSVGELLLIVFCNGLLHRQIGLT